MILVQKPNTENRKLKNKQTQFRSAATKRIVARCHSSNRNAGQHWLVELYLNMGFAERRARASDGYWLQP